MGTLINEYDISKLNYQIFGSKDSIDYDILVIVDKIYSIEHSHALIKQLNEYYQLIYVDKKINCNLGVLANDYTLVDVFKGSVDECNNALYYTYSNHIQPGINLINKVVKRDIELKFKRVARHLLTFFSRDAKLRTEIKDALRSDDFIKRITVIKKINFNNYINFDFKKNEYAEDIWKVISFQLGQVIELYKGNEIYDKDGIRNLDYIPNNFINRKKLSKMEFCILDNVRKEYIKLSEQLIRTMSNFKEL